MRFLTGCAVLPLFFCAGVSANPLIDQLIGATTSFLEQEIESHLQRSARDARYEVTVNRLDNRLRLPLCPEGALHAELESPAEPVGRVTVRLSCDSEVRWRLFVPAQVSLYQPVLVTTRPLSRHAVITMQDITLLERDVGLLNNAYLTDIAQVAGLRLRRQVAADTVLAPNQLEQQEVVKRGDKVVISAANSHVSVRMPGEALENGNMGSQIRVRNSRSGRVVKARITGPGQVEVAM
ncbi:flagellar basal body P-ring formation chaperone FlgA [Halopseudomonas salina]|uniref:Flagella basal body P-ring formation protein FlgA n=1 Tax=Halopseudomonas salina TaxID=1323744 RepID=A0ABQ1NZ52_9GAMM|nr:flagellar basal body P-ring formation chaperone FlgA [Halopseudomonas salina]GGC87728.1 flagella basal body P-ring formation protein FlgA [Halopseudomonas salina]